MAESKVDEAAAMCLLMLEDECSPEELRPALLTLLKMLSNVFTHPTEEKYRTVRKENKAFNAKVWKFEGCQQFLFSLGWIEVDDTIVLPDHNGIEGAIHSIEQQLRMIPGQAAEETNKIKPSWNDREMEDREKKMREEKKITMQRLRREKEEKKRISDQIKADRQETNSREHKDSKAVERRYGANIQRFGDIGVDLNGGGG